MAQLPGETVNNFSAKTLAIALILGILLLAWPFMSGLIGAGILYVAATPAMRRIDPGRRHRWSALLLVVVMLLVIVIPGVWLVGELLAEVPDALRRMQQSVALERLMAIQLGDVNVGSILRQASSEIVSWSSRQTITALSGVMSSLLNLVIALFGAYYLLVGSRTIWERTKALLPFRSTTSELLRVRFQRVTEAMLLGVVLTGLTQGLIVGVTFAAIGIPHPLLWGAATAVVSILPVMGSAIVWFPAAVVLALQDRFAAAAVLAAIGVVIVSNIDNVLRLVVYRRVSQIHPMVTLVGAFAGIKAFGLAGLLIGPLLFSYSVELITIAQGRDPLERAPAPRPPLAPSERNVAEVLA